MHPLLDAPEITLVIDLSRLRVKWAWTAADDTPFRIHAGQDLVAGWVPTRRSSFIAGNRAVVEMAIVLRDGSTFATASEGRASLRGAWRVACAGHAWDVSRTRLEGWGNPWALVANPTTGAATIHLESPSAAANEREYSVRVNGEPVAATVSSSFWGDWTWRLTGHASLPEPARSGLVSAVICAVPARAIGGRVDLPPWVAHE